MFLKNGRDGCSRTLKHIALIAIFFLLSGCIAKNEVSITLKNPTKSKAATTTSNLNVTVSNVQVVNHQIIITGTNLDAVSNFNIKEGGSHFNLQMESQTSTSIVANTLSNVTFAAGKVFDFVFSNANAASSFTINFSLCDSSLGGKGFNCSLTPNDKEVLSYDAVSGKWKPRAVNGLSYQGAWDASTALPSTTTPGDYYIVSAAHGAYNVGDWIVFNGTSFDQINNSATIANVFGRTGAITANKGDYVLTKMGDVDLTTTPPTTNQVLKYNGSNWVPATVTTTESDPTVSAFAKAALPICGAGQVLKSDGTSLSCVTDNVGSSFTGTANRAVITDASGALAVSNISDTVLGYLSGTTSNIQTQLNAKANASSFVDWSVAGVQTLDPTRLNLTTANRVVVTSAGGVPTASGVSSTELGYLSGATGNIQTQLNAKLSAETDPSVSAFAKAALPTCLAGEVLKSDGTSLSCVTDNTGAGSYTGTQNRVVLTDGATGALTTSVVTNTEIGYVGGVTSAIQTQINGKQTTITSSTALTTGSVQTNLQGAVQVNPFNTAAGSTGEFRFYELAANGSNYTGFKSPDNLTANLIYVLPTSAPGAGNVLSSDASGNLSWIAIPSAPVSSVFGRSGAVVSASGDYTATQITNTPAGNIASTTVQAALNELDSKKQGLDATLTSLAAYNTNGILVQTAADTFAGRSIAGTANRVSVTNGDGVAGNPTINLDTSLFPSPIAGDAGKFLKATGSNASSWSALASSDITTALGFTPVNKAGDSLTTGTIALSGTAALTVQNPVNVLDAANKQYVDGFGQWTKGTGANAGDIYRASGNVGIGTATPTGKLHINGSLYVGNNAHWSTNGDDIFLNSGTAASSIYLRPNGDASTISQLVTNTTGLLYYGSSGSEVFRINSSGNVGIGTTAPSNPLTVKSTAANSYPMSIQAKNNTNPLVNIIDNNAAGNGIIDLYANSESGAYTTGVPTARISADSAVPTYFNGGNVGIGTTSPVSILHVQSSGSTIPSFYGADAGQSGLNFGVNTTNRWLLYQDTAGNGRFFGIWRDHSGVGGATGSVMTFLDNGNVGIGTSPSYTLDVNGTVHTNSKVFFNTTNGAFPESEVKIGYTGAGSQFGIALIPSADNTTPIWFGNAADSGVGSISITNSATTYNTTSDRRLKENIVPTLRGLDALLQIEVKDYNFKADPEKKLIQGFIAQDLYKLYPEAVTVGGENPKKNPWAVDYGRLSPLMVKAIQEIKSFVDDLMKASDTHERELASLKRENGELRVKSKMVLDENVQIKRELADLKARMDRLEKSARRE